MSAPNFVSAADLEQLRAKLRKHPRLKSKLLSADDRDDIIGLALSKAFAQNPDFDPRRDELPDKFVKYAKQSFFDADNRANGNPTRDETARRKACETELSAATDPARIAELKTKIQDLHGLQRADEDDTVADTQGPFGSLDLSALVEPARGTRVYFMPMVELLDAGFGNATAPAQRAKTSEVDRDPAPIDFQVLGHNTPHERNHCKLCKAGCWRCQQWRFNPPKSLRGIKQPARADQRVQDAETLTTWRRLFIANDCSDPPIDWCLFDFPLIVEGRTLSWKTEGSEHEESVLTGYMPAAAVNRWKKWKVKRP